MLLVGPENQAASPLNCVKGLSDDSIQSLDSAHFLRIICNDFKVSRICLVKEECIHLLKSHLYRFV